VSRPSIEFLRYLLGIRKAQTALTAAETSLLAALAGGRGSVVEIGVHEGATSARLAAAMAPAGRLWLIDPYLRYTRPERLLGFSFAEHIARRRLRPWAPMARFVRLTSIAAARELILESTAELIFIDGDHSYRAVHEDFLAWGPHLAAAGALAFHDSRRCAARPDLDAETGPVRLVDEILRGEHGAWSLIAEADSIAAFRRAGAEGARAVG
jgi:predicted O-methyltransferase YrrM